MAPLKVRTSPYELIFGIKGRGTVERLLHYYLSGERMIPEPLKYLRNLKMILWENYKDTREVTVDDWYKEVINLI